MTPLLQAIWKMCRRWLSLFLYVAKMAAVEYEKCTSIHTLRFDHFEYTMRVLSVHFVSGQQYFPLCNDVS